MLTAAELERALDARVGAAERSALRDARVAIAGLGGLGSHIAVFLARSGVGHLLLVDFDTVDVTNLNRQAYGIRHLGMPKTDAIREILADINPYLKLQTRRIRVTADNAAALFGDWPILCEAFDVPENKAMLVRTILAECPGTTVVSGCGMAGYGDANAIRTSHPMGRLYLCGDGQTAAGPGAPLFAPRVAVCAGHQANQVLRIILKKSDQ